jgi:single-stranded-DNA-specific exonuclease
VVDEALIARLDADDDPDKVLADLHRLEPCGETNPAPTLAIEAKLTEAREVKGGHLKLQLSLGGSRRLSGFGVGMGERAASLGASVVVLGKLRRDRWLGGRAVEIKIERLFGDEAALAAE